MFDYIADCTTYDAAEKSLTELFVKPKNEVFTRYVLATRHQEPGESFNQFLQALKLLAEDCQFKAVTAVEAIDNYVRDAFINGLGSATIRQLLLENKTLDLQSAFDQAHTLETANGLKQDIAEAVVRAIDPTAPFAVETNASDHAIAATLTQNEQPVTFFSRTLSNSEQRHSSVEEEAYAIVEARRKWRHYLIGRHFRLVTDQRSVAFMFNSKSAGKINNDKIGRWRVELSCHHYDTVYRPGKKNIPADAFSRVCGATSVDELQELHDNLCHPGVSRVAHFVRRRNLPYSVEEVKKMTNSCSACSELKPQFCKFDSGHLIKATQPFERLNIDF
ncbi:uncharacterized protein [Procambarus clarkii]|uniref:uncharacterized protein n=1 Tax=Procambarus clarkii TaxID=6728 RepID=UPI0037423E5D